MVGVVKLNPDIFQDKRDAYAVVVDEALRLWAEETDFKPDFEVTPDQQRFFDSTSYGDDPDAMKKTIVARIATFDTSVKDATPEQVSETLRLLDSALEVFGDQPDGKTLSKIRDELAKTVQDNGQAAPDGNIPAESAEIPANVPDQEQPATAPNEAIAAESEANGPLEVQSAMGGGDVDESVGLAAAVIRENEGFRRKAYWDKTGKTWTVGHGLTVMPDGRKVGPRDSLTEDESAAAMKDYVSKRLLPAAERHVPGWKALDPRLRAAMLDTAYNAGPGYFSVKSPTMLKRLASGEDAAKVIAEENATWTKSKGVEVKGLADRRQRVKERLIDWYVRDRDKAAGGLAANP